MVTEVLVPPSVPRAVGNIFKPDFYIWKPSWRRALQVTAVGNDNKHEGKSFKHAQQATVRSELRAEKVGVVEAEFLNLGLTQSSKIGQFPEIRAVGSLVTCANALFV